jgi:DNA-binding transcriptional LysR family regulator
LSVKHCSGHETDDWNELMDRLRTMEAFVRVVQEGGFAAAARALGVDQALVTRQVATLEQHLGVKLLHRTTRTVRMTEAGETFLTRCNEILSDVMEAEAEVGRSHHNMTGRVRLALPTLFDRRLAARQLATLHQEFPELTVEVALLDHPVDLIAEGFDVAIMDAAFGAPAMAVARPLLKMPLLLCASPDYLQRNPPPGTPQALSKHHCVAQWNIGEAGRAHDHWMLEHIDGSRENVNVPVALRTNTYALTLEAIRCGLALGRLTGHLADEDLAAGRIVRLLPEWNAGQMSCNLVYPGRRMLPRRVLRHRYDHCAARTAITYFKFSYGPSRLRAADFDRKLRIGYYAQYLCLLPPTD